MSPCDHLPHALHHPYSSDGSVLLIDDEGLATEVHGSFARGGYAGHCPGRLWPRCPRAGMASLSEHAHCSAKSTRCLRHEALSHRQIYMSMSISVCSRQGLCHFHSPDPRFKTFDTLKGFTWAGPCAISRAAGRARGMWSTTWSALGQMQPSQPSVPSHGSGLRWHGGMDSIGTAT